MRILAVETSSLTASAAVLDDEGLLGEYTLCSSKTHSRMLVPMIGELLENLNILPGEIDIYAASTGPGSFTGLRIGVTTVKAMAFAVHKPVIGVPTLDALAYNIPVRGNELVCPIMDARNKQVYTAVYAAEKGIQSNITGYMGIPVDELAGMLKGKNAVVTFTGDAVGLYRDFLKKELGENCNFAPLFMQKQKASAVAQLALLKAAGGKLENCFDLLPFYLRKSQAEREYDRKQAEAVRNNL